MCARPLLVGLALNAEDISAPARISDRVRAADELGLNFVLFDDGPGGREGADPIEAASFASALTHRTGLVATAAATHAEPYHLSNRFSSLDWGSSGRAGWLVTVDASADRARAYSAAPPGPEAARREADTVVDAARRLWDSWEDGALIADSASGRFLDNEKLHYVDAGGDLFRVRGPALMPRPVQGQVVVFAWAGDDIAAADVTVICARQGEDGVPADAARARAAGARRVLAEIDISSGPALTGLLRRLAGNVDGVLLRARDVGGALNQLGREALPELAADGVVTAPRSGQTLRQQLDLPRPPSRYAAP